MRGDKRAALQAAQAARWITPACAGIRSTPSLATATVKDHPRMRGDKPTYQSTLTGQEGSPPHARG